jgi:DNA-binding NtrC family response regulator
VFDDEIDILKPHIIFLEQKGYTVVTAKSGDEALDRFNESIFDLVFLDENMPGFTGLETLVKMKAIRPNIPIIMITKSEEESIMEEAIGSKISDYLIKPVNPNQILLSIKKNIDSKRLVGERTTMNYQQEFRNIGMRLSESLSKQEWIDIFKKLTFWELEIEKSGEQSVEEILSMQKQEANTQFFRFVKENYKSWIKAMGHPLHLSNFYSFPLQNEKIGYLPLVFA